MQRGWHSQASVRSARASLWSTLGLMGGLFLTLIALARYLVRCVACADKQCWAPNMCLDRSKCRL